MEAPVVPLDRSSLPGSLELAAFYMQREDGAELPKELPPEILHILETTAALGDVWHEWLHVRSALAFLLDNSLRDYNVERTSEVDIGPLPPLFTEESFGELQQRLQSELAAFTEGPPFTVQRLCEVLLRPQDTYSTLDKFALAIEKLLLVTTTIPLSNTRYPTELPPRRPPPPVERPVTATTLPHPSLPRPPPPRPPSRDSPASPESMEVNSAASGGATSGRETSEAEAQAHYEIPLDATDGVPQSGGGIAGGARQGVIGRRTGSPLRVAVRAGEREGSSSPIAEPRTPPAHADGTGFLSFHAPPPVLAAEGPVSGTASPDAVTNPVSKTAPELPPALFAVPAGGHRSKDEMLGDVVGNSLLLSRSPPPSGEVTDESGARLDQATSSPAVEETVATNDEKAKDDTSAFRVADLAAATAPEDKADKDGRSGKAGDGVSGLIVVSTSGESS